MAVNSVYQRVIAQGDGQNVEFGFPWKFVAESDIMVYVDDALQPVSAYQITHPITKDSGKVVFNTAPAVGAIVVIRRMNNLQQARMFKNQENFNANEIEKAFDKLTLLIQDSFEELSRSTLLMKSQSNLDFTIGDLFDNDKLLTLDIDSKQFVQTSFTQEQVQTLLENAIRSVDLSVLNQAWNGSTLTIDFGDNTSKKGIVSGSIAQLRAQHDDQNRWWVEWSVDGETWAGVGGIAGGSAHNNLIDRDAEDAHPMSAITGLVPALNAITEEVDELAASVNSIDTVKDFVGFQDGGALNAFIGLSDATSEAKMANDANGGYISYEDITNKQKGSLSLNGVNPRMTLESTAADPEFKVMVELQPDGLYLSDGTMEDNFVKIPSALDLGMLMKSVGIAPNDTSTVILNLMKLNTQNGSMTTDQLPLPVASETQAGVWNPAMYESFLATQENINALLTNQSIPTVDMETDSPTSSELTTAYTQAKQTPPQSGSRLYNSFDSSVWLCLDGTNWVIVSGTAVSNAIATQTVPGVVLSRNSDGMVYVESQGAMSVVGWDSLKGRVSTNETNITALQSAVDSLDLSAYLPTAGGSMTGTLNASPGHGITFGATTGVKISGNATIGGFNFAANNATRLAFTSVAKALYPIDTGISLGASSNKFSAVYAGKLNNGGDLSLPTTAGTLALTSQIPTVPPVITSVVRNETTGVLTVVFSKTPTNKNVYKLASGSTIAGAWALQSGTTWKFTPTTATDITENDWGVSCS